MKNKNKLMFIKFSLRKYYFIQKLYKNGFVFSFDSFCLLLSLLEINGLNVLSSLLLLFNSFDLLLFVSLLETNGLNVSSLFISFCLVDMMWLYTFAKSNK